MANKLPLGIHAVTPSLSYLACTQRKGNLFHNTANSNIIKHSAQSINCLFSHTHCFKAFFWIILKVQRLKTQIACSHSYLYFQNRMLGDKEENTTQTECKLTCAITIGTMFSFPQNLKKAGRLHHLLDKTFKARYTTICLHIMDGNLPPKHYTASYFLRPISYFTSTHSSELSFSTENFHTA